MVHGYPLLLLLLPPPTLLLLLSHSHQAHTIHSRGLPRRRPNYSETDIMADDSVPLPFPNIKVPRWHYQIEHVERLKGEAEERFWKAVEEDGTSLLSTQSSALGGKEL